MSARYETAEWIELSGLPAELNAMRAGAWPVFKELMELDCRRNRTPDAVEISLGELAARCGLEWDKLAKLLEALRKKKLLGCFVPDNPDEPGLFQIRVPIQTPKSPEEVSRVTSDPHLRDPTSYRYTRAETEKAPDEKKVQRIIDLYLNTLSQKVNSFIVDEIEMLAQRFPIEAIESTIERAARHEIRSLGWVAKELIRDAARPKGESRRRKKS